MVLVVQCIRKLFIWYYAVLIVTATNIKGEWSDHASNKEEPALTDHNKGCWVFLHMPKSGGTTVKKMIRVAANANHMNLARLTNRNYIDGARGRREAKHVLRTGEGIVYGGYAETLRASAGHNECKWFTVFRHPVSRLVSAYFYCKFVHRQDQLCNKIADVNLKTTDIASFAERWGNYGLRQYALAFFSADDVLASRASRICKGCSGWFRVKRYLEDLQQQSLNDKGITVPSNSVNDDFSLYAFLEPALETISSKYAAVGILEDFNTTMHLFDSALGIPKFSWSAEINNLGAANSDEEHKDEEHAALLEASTDPSIIRFIWLDMVLYEHAMSIHTKQVKQYGLEKA